MINTQDVLETIQMIREENLDIRTVTMGISQWDCVSEDTDRLCTKIYDKITRQAERLVSVGCAIEKKYGIPIVNKRVSVTPVSLIGGDATPEGYLKIAHTLQRAADALGINFLGGFSALVQKGMTKGADAMISVIPEALAETRNICSSVNVASTKAGINMDTYKYYIDFASRNGIEFIVLDEGWYDPKSGDMLTVIPELDLPELIAYGKSKGVEIVLWTVFNVLDSQLEAACKKYADMGIKGFKVDFLDRDDQTAVEMVYRIAEMTARYKLTLDLHGIYKPTGINRTYPHIINFESVFGMEEVKWTDIKNNMPLYDVTFPYIRMMAGPVDYTPGAMRNATKADWRAMYYTPASMGTRCHQLAAYIVHDSPFTMLCDAPTNYLNEQECVDFITSLPVETDSTFIASGELGKYIVTVRKKDVNWYVGGMTNWDRRDVELDFSFLPEGVRYTATLFVDGINADKQAEDYRMEKRIVDRESRMKLHLASGGGFAMKLELCPLRGRVTAVPEGKGIPSFYKKYIETEGLYVTSSERVSDEALLKACDIISLMLAKRPDVKAHMVKRGCHVMVIGKDEETCDLPEFAHICNCEDSIKYWNWRARGFGGAPEDELSSSCGEENLLALPQDKYVGENILIHEFAHLIHTVGIVGVEPGFNDRLETLRQNAIRKGLWKDTYAVSNKEEYFAECVQSFFNCNRYADPANGVHNWVNRRAKLKSYDPDMYRLLQEYFYEIEIPINNIVHK